MHYRCSRFNGGGVRRHDHEWTVGERAIYKEAVTILSSAVASNSSTCRDQAIRAIVGGIITTILRQDLLPPLLFPYGYSNHAGEPSHKCHSAAARRAAWFRGITEGGLAAGGERLGHNPCS